VLPRKNRPVLFEVVARSRGARGRNVVRSTAKPLTPVASGMEAGAAQPDEPPQPETLGESAGGRLRLSLGWVELTAAGVMLIALLWGAYYMGSRSAQPAPRQPDDFAKLLTSKPEPERADATPPPVGLPRRRSAQPVATPPAPDASDRSGGERSAQKPATPPTEAPPPAQPANQPAGTPTPDAGPAVSFEPGTHYIVVQHFPVSARDKADAARTFLADKGIVCLVRKGNGDLELVTQQTFKNEADAKNLLKRITDLGKEYFQGGGGYDFGGAKLRKS
jgi:hypothetical protein